MLSTYPCTYLLMLPCRLRLLMSETILTELVTFTYLHHGYDKALSNIIVYKEGCFVEVDCRYLYTRADVPLLECVLFYTFDGVTALWRSKTWRGTWCSIFLPAPSSPQVCTILDVTSHIGDVLSLHIAWKVKKIVNWTGIIISWTWVFSFWEETGVVWVVLHWYVPVSSRCLSSCMSSGLVGGHPWWCCLIWWCYYFWWYCRPWPLNAWIWSKLKEMV